MVKKIEYIGEASLQKVSNLLEQQTELQRVDLINWEEFPYQPDVAFRIAHSNNQIWLKFYITEENILAERTATNSATHKDSCVEFFIDTQQDGNYYNFEFNCIGTTHLAYGPNVGSREFISPELIKEKIKIKSTLGEEPFGERTGGHSWEMTVIIPSEIFIHDEEIQLSNFKANANFYKCGDDTSIEHYLSWNPVKSEHPNFHQPSFFGTLVFE
ncbi:MAG: carbohydrate-binding family 9-like protein [Flavobacteriaceae bacterium]